MDNRVITIDLLRHGATEGGPIYRGTTDSALSAEGAKQMKQTVSDFSLASVWQKVFSSPLQRCSNFAQSFATAGNVPLVLDKNLREIDFGDWEGRDVSAVWRDFPQQAEAFWRTPEDNPPPGGETIAELQSRVDGFLDRIIAGDDDNLLVVSHGGVIRGILAQVLQLPPSSWSTLQLDHASLSRIQLGFDNEQGGDDGKGWASVAFINWLPDR